MSHDTTVKSVHLERTIYMYTLTTTELNTYYIFVAVVIILSNYSVFRGLQALLDFYYKAMSSKKIRG